MLVRERQRGGRQGALALVGRAVEGGAGHGGHLMAVAHEVLGQVRAELRRGGDVRIVILVKGFEVPLPMPNCFKMMDNPAAKLLSEPRRLRATCNCRCGGSWR